MSYVSIQHLLEGIKELIIFFVVWWGNDDVLGIKQEQLSYSVKDTKMFNIITKPQSFPTSPRTPGAAETT